MASQMKMTMVKGYLEYEHLLVIVLQGHTSSTRMLTYAVHTEKTCERRLFDKSLGRLEPGR